MSRLLLLLHSISSYCYYRINSKAISKFIDYLIRFSHGAWIPGSAIVGTRTRFAYGGLGIVLHNRAVIGNDCLIDQNVTIGGTSKKWGVPKLGNHVYVGANAVIIGPIEIGDNVVIGANALVNRSVPSNSLVVGVPARVIKTGIKMSSYV